MSRVQAHARHHLSAEAVDHFKREGFIVPHYRIEGDDFAQLKMHAERIAEQNRTPNDRIRQVFLPKRDGKTEGVEGGEHLFRWAIHSEILDIVEQLIGPDIVLIGSFMIAKPAGAGKRVPWHQDGYYLRENVTPAEAVTVWIAIDNVTTENGCVRFVPGTKKLGILPTRQEENFGDEIEAGAFDDSHSIAVELSPGQFSIHDANVVHGSEANDRGGRRLGYSFNFIPAYCHYHRDRDSIGKSAYEKPAETSTRPIWLVRGNNLNPLNDFDVGHEGLERLDAMVEAGRAASVANLHSAVV